jgi:hypothetical protein
MADVKPSKTLGTAPRWAFFETIGECLHEYLPLSSVLPGRFEGVLVNLAHLYRSICCESTCY